MAKGTWRESVFDLEQIREKGMDIATEGYEPGRECAICRGRCCREKGCSLSPEDMKKELKKQGDEEIDALSENVLSGRILSMLKDPECLYAIDYFSAEDGPCFYLRMRHKCYTFVGIDAIGECIALTEEGCLLSQEKRPKGGRLLESNENMHCVQHYTREMMCKDWRPYQKVLRAIFEEYEKKFQEDGTFEQCDAAYFAWMKSQREKSDKDGINKYPFSYI